MFLSLNTERLEEHCSALDRELVELETLIALLEMHNMMMETGALSGLYDEQLIFLNKELSIILQRKKVLTNIASIVNETVCDLEEACMFSNEQLNKLDDDTYGVYDR